MWTPASMPEVPHQEQGSRPMGREGEQAAQSPGWLEGSHSLSTGAYDRISRIKYEPLWAAPSQTSSEGKREKYSVASH